MRVLSCIAILSSDQTVLIKGNRIVAVGSAAAIEVPDQAHVVDATGNYLIPGLWDVHVHSATSIDWQWSDRRRRAHHPTGLDQSPRIRNGGVRWLIRWPTAARTS